MTRTKPPKQKRRKLRRTKFNGIKYKPAYLDKVSRPGSKPSKWNPGLSLAVCFLAAEGYTEKEIATKIDVHEHTINYWKRTKPEFLAALRKGKNEYTNRVESSLVESAVGYSHPDTDIRVVDGEIVVTPIIKHYPPNPTAMIFYLKNRARDRWMDVHKIEGEVFHRHLLDLTDLTDEELDACEVLGLKQLPEHGNGTD